MKSLKLILLCAAALTGAITTILIQRQPAHPRAVAPIEQRFHVRGEIRGIDGEAKQIRIKHEEIPDYMAAMTMPFDVRDSGLLRGLKIGDEIGFELVVTREDSWISSIQKLSETAMTAITDISRNATNEIERVQIGETVPNFTLTAQNGETIQLKGFRGQAVLVTFIYTRCPLPNYCPLMSKNFASLQERLGKKFPGKFHLISVSIDPLFDQPAVLKKYAVRYTEDDSSWTFATGNTEQIDAIGNLFGLVQERAGGLINHDLRTALIGPDGRLVHVWKSNAWTPFEIQRRVEELFQTELANTR
jgi:protein SCO1/2